MPIRRHRTEANTVAEPRRGPDLRVASESDDRLAPGTTVGGKFRLERVLGKGGMGIVMAATHVELDERVALKFLAPQMKTNEVVRARFVREARASVKLKSEHVARVLDVGTHDGSPFMVMEYLEGSDLGSVISERAPLGIGEATEYLIHACEGLAEAHARGIVHRDIKPENLFVASRGDDWPVLKVLDFGISKAALTGVIGGVDLSRHETTSMMGSPHYMSPEQLRSTKNVDRRADIWSLGVVLYELLTGELPFSTDLEFTALVAAILETSPPLVTALNPDVPVALEAIVLRCLDKSPDQRFQSTAELAIALLDYAPKRARTVADRAVRWARSSGGEKLSMPPSIPPSSGAVVGGDTSSLRTIALSHDTTIPAPAGNDTPAPVAPLSQPPRRGIGGIVVAVVVLALAALAAALLWPPTKTGGTDRPVASSTSEPVASTSPTAPLTAPSQPAVDAHAAMPSASAPSTSSTASVTHMGPGPAVKPLKTAAPVSSGLEIHKTR